MDDHPNPQGPDPKTPPLTPAEAGELSVLVAKGEAITAEEHARATVLYDQAKAHASAWEADAEVAGAHLYATLEQMWAGLLHIVDVIPAAGGLRMMVNNIRANLDGMQRATVPPTPPPEVPAPRPIVEEPAPPPVAAELVAEPPTPEPQPDHTEDAAAPAVEPIVEPDPPAPQPAPSPMPGGSIPQLGGETPPAEHTEAKTEDQHTDAPA